jgi:ferredoxin
MKPPRSLRSLPLQGALAASDQPFARHEQSPGLFVSGLTPEGALSGFGRPGATETQAVTITLANRSGASFRVDRRRPLLDALEAQGVSLPYGCRYGGCISCAAKLLSGEIDQSAGVALNRRQLADGYVLLCIARPLTDRAFDVGVESHDKLYRNPFASPLAPHELKPDIATPLKHGP